MSNNNIDEAIIMLSKLTHRVGNITLFTVITLIVFILGPFKINQLSKKLIKFVLSIILIIILYTNYIGITGVEKTFNDSITNDDSWSSIATHITYNYMYCGLLGIFISFLLYSCI
jgi:hypothetical protein